MQENIVDDAFEGVAEVNILGDARAQAVELSEIALREEMTVYICTTNWPL